MTRSAGPAVKLTCCWPKATTAAKGRILATRSAAFTLSLKLFVLIVFPPSSVALVDYKFPGIDQHHHQHSAGERITRCDLALVVGVPHKRKARLARGRVRDRARRRSDTGAAARRAGRGANGRSAS